MQGLQVVLGATGGAGSAVVTELVARHAHVRAVSRSTRGAAVPGVERVQADVTDRSNLRDACQGAVVVYHCVNVPYQLWAVRLRPIAEAVVAASSEAGARLVVMDNLYMYGRVSGPMTETSPRNAQGMKGRLRVDLEQLFLDAHRSGRVRVTIGRASDFYGTQAANSAPMFLVVTPALRGRTASWLGSLDSPHTLSYLPDVAKGLVTLAARDEALGEIWHLPAAEPLTGRQFIELVFRQLGQRPRMRLISRMMMRLAGAFSPLIRESLEVLYQFEDPFIMDASKFTRAFGSQVTSHAEAIPRCVDELRAVRPH